MLGCNVITIAPHEALKSIPRGKLTFDERCVIHRVKGAWSDELLVEEDLCDELLVEGADSDEVRMIERA